MLTDISSKVLKFRDDRDWGKFNSPLNLLISLQIELAELMEHFQWMDNNEFSNKYESDPRKKNNISEEIADVFWYLLLLADSLKIDLEWAILRKMKENAKKYPIEKAKGNCKKYTEFSLTEK